MDNALYQLRQYESEIQMKNMENKMKHMSINKAYEYIDSHWPNDAHYIKDAYEAIVSSGLLNWFKTFEPTTGFMFSSTPELSLIRSKMKLIDCHSGASYAFTMRAVQNVVKNN